MQQSERLERLAERIRLGKKLNWKAESDAMAIDLVAQNAKFAEDAAEQSARQLQGFSGVGNQESRITEEGNSEVS